MILNENLEALCKADHQFRLEHLSVKLDNEGWGRPQDSATINGHKAARDRAKAKFDTALAACSAGELTIFIQYKAAWISNETIKTGESK